MGRPPTLIRSILEVVGLAGLILVLVLLLRARPGGDQPGAQPAATPQPYPLNALPEQALLQADLTRLRSIPRQPHLCRPRFWR